MNKKKLSREKQHYVPQLILKRFAFKGKGKINQIHIFDKHTGKSFQTGTNNILAENNFYDVCDQTAEPSLSSIENCIEPVLLKIIESEDLSILTESDKIILAIYVAIQKLRVKNFRRRHQDLAKSILERFGTTPEYEKQLREQLHYTDEEVKAFSINFMAKNSIEFGESILEKDWHLLKTDTKNPFWITDNPVVFYNDNKSDFRGNLGLSVKGIQVYLPISPTLTLSFWCKSIKKEIEDSLAETEATLQHGKILRTMANKPLDKFATQRLEQHIAFQNGLLDSLNSGKPKMANLENVMFYNSLQYRYAERYIISNSSDFSFAEQMAKENPQWKSGAEIKMN